MLGNKRRDQWVEEQLKYFKQEQLATYTELQGKIIENLIPALKLHGHLLFATCSVYKNENENNVAKLLATGKFKVVKQQYFTGGLWGLVRLLDGALDRIPAAMKLERD